MKWLKFEFGFFDFKLLCFLRFLLFLELKFYLFLENYGREEELKNY